MQCALYKRLDNADSQPIQSTREKHKLLFVPPKPKLLVKATSIRRSCALFGA